MFSWKMYAIENKQNRVGNWFSQFSLNRITQQLIRKTEETNCKQVFCINLTTTAYQRNESAENRKRQRVQKSLKM